MKPTTYLNLGAGLVFLILGAIVAMGWFASNRVGDQHALFLAQQRELRALDQLRVSTNRIVSSTNEFALLALTSAPKNEVGEEESGELTAMQRERQLIDGAIAEFRVAYGALPAVQPAQDSPENLGSLFEGLLKINSELFAAIESSKAESETVFELKEKQEDAETELLDTIAMEQKAILSYIESRGGDLAADFSSMKNFELAAGLAAALILLLSTAFISRRVGAMFAEIGDQRSSIEKANTDLNASIVSLQSLQLELVEKEKLSTLGRLTATVSHELRNPLAAIRNSAFILKQGVAHLPELLQFTSRIDRNITRCDHIIADLLEYSRTRPLDTQPVDLCQWLEVFANEQDLPADISMTLNLPADPVMASIDEHRFRRVTVNLVENACQAIAASGRPGMIWVICAQQPEGPVIKVEDDGPGMTKDVMKKIFEPLFTTRNFGAGLGLPIARNLVVEHGGTIAVQERAGGGASFTISLPAISGNQGYEAAA